MNRVVLHPETYVDSVLLLAATRAMDQTHGVSFATAVMATPANMRALHDAGVDDPILATASANDLLLAVTASDADAGDAAVAAGEHALFDARPSHGSAAPAAVRTIDAAVDGHPGTNVAIVSVPGPFAAIEAHKALGRGLHVLLFSDNVAIDEEVELKERAVRLRRLVMGPGAGTAVIGGCGLGFANVVATGRVGVVAAAGTGAQEVMSLLDQWGEGVSQVIGVGGRDLSTVVGGRMARAAVRVLDADPGTDAILLVSKPPAPDVAQAVIDEATTTPLVAALVGSGPSDERDGPRHRIVGTLEAGAAVALRMLGHEPPDLTAAVEGAVETALGRLGDGRTLVHGLFSGGTLCYEALTLLTPILGPVYSNIPLDKRYGRPAPDCAHVCLDLGEEAYTRGRPHPMIDPEARLELLGEVGGRDDVAAILLDVVLGYGAHDDPAGALAPICAEITEHGGPVVVAYVLGTRGDPQGLEDQRRRLRATGCIVAPTAARASLVAAALARRDPALVKAALP